MRQIILDTETTGLDSSLGHRIIEVAAIEVINRRITGRNFQRYVNPGREIDEGAKKVHGLTEVFLSDKPSFGEIVVDFLKFVSGSELIIHNAPFDVAFLDSELHLCNRQELGTYVEEIKDSLVIAKELHPGKRNSLDALCDRYRIDNSKRSLHGALLDSRLLAECYLAMTRRQESLLIADSDNFSQKNEDEEASKVMPVLQVRRASEQEVDAHNQYLHNMAQENGKHTLWAEKTLPDETEV